MKLEKFDGSKTFFFSDPHYNHRNICSATSTWTDTSGCRQFKSLDLMNEALVFGVNSTVGEDDTLICLGDWSFGGKESIRKFRERIVCKEIHWVLGNHDQHCNEYPELFTEMYNYWQIQVDKQVLCLMHYPIEEWDDRHHAAWMLHGHSHGGSRTIPGRLDVGVDNAFKLFGEYRPFRFSEICDILGKK